MDSVCFRRFRNEDYIIVIKVRKDVACSKEFMNYITHMIMNDIPEMLKEKSLQKSGPRYLSLTRQ